MRSLLDLWLLWSDETLSGGCLFVAASFELDDQPGPLRDMLVRNERDWLDVIAAVAGTAVAEGEFRADTDVEQFAFEAHAVTLAYHHASRLMHDPRAVARARRSFDSLLAAARA